jgi:DnaJ domain
VLILTTLLRFACLKDYYNILNIPITATIPEIKQAYRKLVMIYHPDKNNEDPYSLLKFNDIKEAYDVLISPRKKEAYLQERWLNKAKGQRIGQDIVTAPGILMKSLELNKAIATMDAYRMDYKNIAAGISTLLSDDVIKQLLELKETDIHPSIIRTLIKTTAPLPYRETNIVAIQLRKLANEQPLLLREIEQALMQKKQQENWSNRKGIVVILLTLLICLLIYFSVH